MTGFEVKIADQTILASIGNGMCHIIFSYSYIDQKPFLFVGGIDRDKSQHVRWYNGYTGDIESITIKIVDVHECTQVVEAYSTDQGELREYNHLKQKLEKEGMI